MSAADRDRDDEDDEVDTPSFAGLSSAPTTEGKLTSMRVFELTRALTLSEHAATLDGLCPARHSS